MKKEIVFIDDDTLTPEELAMLSDEFGVEFVTEKTKCCARNYWHLRVKYIAVKDILDTITLLVLKLSMLHCTEEII